MFRSFFTALVLASTVAVGVPLNTGVDFLHLAVELAGDISTDRRQRVFAVEMTVDGGKRVHLTEERLRHIAAKELVTGSVQAFFSLTQCREFGFVPFVHSAVRLDVDAFQRLDDFVKLCGDAVEAIHNADVGRSEGEFPDLFPRAYFG